MLATTAPFCFNTDNLQAALVLTAEQQLGHRDFLLCESCFWCASYVEHDDASRCPVCKGSRLARLSVE
jgi:hypothetical protein